MNKRSRRPQDQPQTKIRVSRRREKLTKIFAKGATVSKAHEQLREEGIEVCRATVGFDLQAIRGDFADRLPQAREDAYNELQQLKKLVAKTEKMRLGEKIDKHLAIHDRVARLLGLDAPTKSVSASISANAGGPSEAFEFLRHAHGLSEEQLAEVYSFMDQLPRKPLTLDARFFNEPEQTGEEEVK
jgi:hypothetical protein